MAVEKNTARDLAGRVVVITGASSGIGRATALAFADCGASIVGVARSGDALAEVVNECERRGGQALGITADVADETAIDMVRQAAVDRFGGIDVWVNNAAVASFGTFEDTPSHVARRLVETNLIGTMNGTRAALRQFRGQGNRGTIVNVASVDGKVAAAYQAVYAATKFALVGFADSVRQELRLEGSNVRLTTVLPATIATPLFEHAANYSGHALEPMNPVYSAERAAATVVACALDPKREAYVGSVGRTLQAVRATSPGLFERLFARQVRTDLFGRADAGPSEGNLFAPVPARGNPVSGDYRAATGPAADAATTATGLGLAAVVGLVTAALLLRRVV